MTPPPIRIAILEADTPIGKARAKYGSYGGVFTLLLYRAADASDIPRERLEITGWDVVGVEGEQEGEEEVMGGEWNMRRRKGYPKMEDIDAILITGSRFNAFDDHPWVVRLVDFVKEVLAQDRVKIIGVCYGHQIVGRALGAKVARSESGAWEVSVCQVAQTETGKELFGGKDSLSIYQMHRDHVYPPLPPFPSPSPHSHPSTQQQVQIHLLGSSPACTIQGMYLPQKFITVQGHPEFTPDIVTELLESRREQGVFGEGIYEDGMGRVRGAHDGVVVAGAWLRFLIG